MATIDYLPVEILSRILELAGEHELRDRYGERRTALATLASASLVAQRWREPAQAVMWLRVGLSGGAAKRILASPVCGRYRTAEVVFCIGAEGDGETTERVLQRLRGIESLALESRRSTREGVGWLSLPSLRDLKILKINASFIKDVSLNLRPSFHLQTLTLGPNADSAALNHALLATSSSSLLSLSHFHLPTSVKAALIVSLPLVANHLTSLFFLEPLPGLLPVLSTFTSLTTLTLTLRIPLHLPEYDILLAAFSPPIKSVTLLVRYHDREILAALAETVQRGPWLGLKELGFTPTTRRVWRRKRVWKALMALCEERGVEVVDLAN